ncbi:MAG: DUF4410 domain-containing protein [Terrimicrobiaceae bacterium]|nr:DUF4410 domain-containing protein [Terrimicrobiaceae bacterium]
MDIRRASIKKKTLMFRISWLHLSCAALAAALGACASVSVRSTQAIPGAEPRQAPSKIFVQPFQVEGPGIRVDRSGAELEKFQRELGEKLAARIAENINKNYLPAEVLPTGVKPPRGKDWLVGGRVTRVHQGSRFLRAIVGLGTGGTRFETTAWVSSLAKRQPQRFFLVETYGGSNVSPGVLGTTAYFVGGITSLFSLANAVEGVRTGVSFDKGRTAHEISAAISEYMYQRGFLPREKAHAPKRPGQWGINFGPFRRKPAPPTAAGP